VLSHFLLKPRGTVYTAVLNFRGERERLGDALNQDPYKKPPEAPILFIKPPNTWAHSGAGIPCPAGAEQLKMGGTLAVVIGRTASRVTPAEALGYVAGYTIANDVSIPHESYYRPPIAQRCRDGFCPIAAGIKSLANPDHTEIRILVNGELRASNNTANLVRAISQLISDVTEFMTLNFGDVLLVGEPENAPLAKAGDTVRVEIEGLGVLENRIMPEEAAQ
jgi:5-oxopent-3-ene-1,2,5-tricarboxylate decarboxylase / 2-hydroxyhepta-2,4-diene-1,7-dioate isomerase